jgi:hypothetical protein
MVEQVPPATKRYPLTSLLGDLGVLPFVLLAGLIVQAALSGLGWYSAVLFGLSAAHGFMAYSAVILSFLAGALWERSRMAQSDGPTGQARALILLSNLVALVAWSCLLLFSVAPNIMSYISLLWVERSSQAFSSTRALFGGSYESMRLRITLIVVSGHLLVAAVMVADLA